MTVKMKLAKLRQYHDSQSTAPVLTPSNQAVSKFIVFMDFTLALLYLDEIPPNLVYMFKGVDAHTPSRSHTYTHSHALTHTISYWIVAALGHATIN